MPLPVTILTGFLGAGKTTLLRRLLAAPHVERIGVLMNEIGPGGVDGVASQMIELTEGCVCCVHNPDLVEALNGLAARGDLDRVVLETTGLADPLPLTWTFSRADLETVARLDAVICVVDAANQGLTQVPEWRAQVACADIVVISKVALAGPAAAQAARDAVASVNRAARIVDAGDDLPLDLLFDVTQRGARAGEAAPGRHSDFNVVSITGVARYRVEPLEDLLETLPRDVFRAKGVAELNDGRWAAFHVVGGRLQLDFDAPAPPHRESRLLFFGRRLREEDLAPLVAACRA